MEEEKKKDSEDLAEEDKEQKESKDEESEELEEEELFADDEDFGGEQESTWEQAKIWFQDNLRVILSVLIVALIAVGIYNYSKKPEEQSSKVDQIIGEQGIEAQEGQGEQANQGAIEVKSENQNDNKGQVVVKGENQPEAQTQPQPSAAEQQPAGTQVQKTAEGYQAMAVAGDGVTHLARKALKDYLNGNPDAGISKEQKIYIEDYMRKHVSQGSLRVGDSRTFSDNLLKDAITKSKQLNQDQLRNLQRYSARVSSL